MIESWETKIGGPPWRRPADLDAAVMLISERSLGEILGWDLVDWRALEACGCLSCHALREQAGEPSIHDRLQPLFDRGHRTSGDFRGLRPSPVVNGNLTRLVGYLCRHFGEHHVPALIGDGNGMQRTIEQETLHQGVAGRMVQRIDTDPVLGARAAVLKEIAAAAEGELEKHVADLINAGIEQDFLRSGAPAKLRIRSLETQAREHVEAALALNRIELFGLSIPDLALDDDQRLRIEMARILLGRFPYFRNYELMMLAELAMLQQPLSPRFLRERDLGAAGAPAHLMIHRLDTVVADLGRALADPKASHWGRSFADKTIAFCGSGPLPMSALLLHLMTGARVILVERDRQSILRSRRLLSNLERLGILAPNALLAVHQDAGETAFNHTDKRNKAAPGSGIACDAVIVASLVDQGAKTRIARHFRDDPDAPELLIMRSARSLSARLAYDAVPTAAFGSLALAFCGETLPATQIATHLGRLDAIREGAASAASKDVLAIAHGDVVNTTEVYRKLRLPPDTPALDFTANATISDLTRELERMMTWFS